MATYALYTASLGSQFANDPVKIFDSTTQVPAIVMASATGGFLNDKGLATLDGSGNLSVYLDSSKTWSVNPYPLNSPISSSSNTQESTQLLVKTAVQQIVTNTGGGGGGAATSALQTTGNTSLASIDGKVPAKGSATSANATPVVIASDQAAVPVTVSGVATAANQATSNTSLATIATNTTGASTAANQATSNTSLATIATNTTGASTAAKQDTGNTSLATIAASVGPVSPTDRSAKITTGGTAQSLMGSNSTRRGYWFQNQSTGDLWINELGTAVVLAAGTPQSLQIPAGTYYESPMNGTPTGAISVIGATTGQQFAAREW
jgi:hypothetical protein